MASRSSIELNSHLKVHDFYRSQLTARLPFLVNMRLGNLAYAATFEDFRPDKSMVTAALVAHAPGRADDLGEMLTDYQSIRVRDFKPEVRDMKVSRGKRPMQLHATDLEPTGIKLPEPVYERLGMLVSEASEYDYAEDTRVNMSSLTAALITSAAVEGSSLRELIEAYQAVTLGDFDPAAELPLAR